MYIKEKLLILIVFIIVVIYVVPESIPSNKVKCYEDTVSNIIPEIDYNIIFIM